jgi:hypothetical protein
MRLLTERKKMEINKVALRAFYDLHKEDYFRRRHSGDAKLWDELYKWDILPRLNKELAQYQSATKESVAEVARIVTHHTNASNFASWRDIDDLKDFLQRPKAYTVIDELWRATPESVDQHIDSAGKMTQFLMSDKKFAPSTWAYLLAARDCHSFALYRDTVMRQVAEICGIDKPATVSQGKKYALVNDAALYLGELMQRDVAEESYIQALNGQDFLWVVLMYGSLQTN